MVRSAHVRTASALLLGAIVTTTTLLLGTRTGTATAAQSPAGGVTVRFVPGDLQDTAWLDRLRDAQVKAAAGVKTFHDFQFTDRLTESGIAFKHRVVDDAGKTYKAAHYDHGNGVAIADVDGDGLSDIYFVNQVGGNELWKNLGGGKFQDVTASAGVGGARTRSACPPRLPTSTTTATRTSTSRPFAAATCSS